MFIEIRGNYIERIFSSPKQDLLCNPRILLTTVTIFIKSAKNQIYDILNALNNEEYSYATRYRIVPQNLNRLPDALKQEARTTAPVLDRPKQDVVGLSVALTSTY